MSLVSLIRMFVYKSVISREANLKWGKNGVTFSLSIRSLGFFNIVCVGEGGKLSNFPK